MRILFLSVWCPFPADNGAKLRAYHLLRGLARRHEVDLVSFCPEGDDGSRAAHLARFCREVTLVPETPFAARRAGAVVGFLAPQPRSIVANFSPAMAAQARRRWAARRYDAVVAGSLHMAPYALRLPNACVILEELELERVYGPYRLAAGGRARLRAGLTWWKTARYVRGVRGAARATPWSRIRRPPSPRRSRRRARARRWCRTGWTWGAARRSPPSPSPTR